MISADRNRGQTVQVQPWQVYTQNGVVTLAMPMDDFGRTQLTEAFLQRCFDFIAAGLEDIGFIQASTIFQFSTIPRWLVPNRSNPALYSNNMSCSEVWIDSNLSGGPCFGALPFGCEPQRHSGCSLSDASQSLQRRPGPATAAGAAPRGTAERGLLRAAPADATELGRWPGTIRS